MPPPQLAPETGRYNKFSGLAPLIRPLTPPRGLGLMPMERATLMHGRERCLTIRDYSWKEV